MKRINVKPGEDVAIDVGSKRAVVVRTIGLPSGDAQVDVDNQYGEEIGRTKVSGLQPEGSEVLHSIFRLLAGADAVDLDNGLDISVDIKPSKDGSGINVIFHGFTEPCRHVALVGDGGAVLYEFYSRSTLMPRDEWHTGIVVVTP